jgi:GGDEF domain-containing protein
LRDAVCEIEACLWRTGLLIFTFVTDDLTNPTRLERLARAARAARALSETLWEALQEELDDRSNAGQHPPRVAELSERLVDISATVALLARVDAGASPAAGHAVAGEQPKSSAARLTDDESPLARGDGSPLTREPPIALESPIAGESPMEAVLVDELAPKGSPAIEVRDERGGRDPNAWIAAIGHKLERYERDGLGFAVLLVELADVERLRHAELPGEVSRLTGLVEAALAHELRPADSLTRESPGRYWLLAPETDWSGARALAEHLVSAVRAAAGHRGTPLEIAVGVAMCPSDGGQAAALAAHADMALYAARASGRPLAP